MKYIITENRLNNLVYSFLDSKDWYTQDNDGKLDISNAPNGEPVLRYRDRVTDKPTLFISDDLYREIYGLFRLNEQPGLSRIVEWFNEKYDKSRTSKKKLDTSRFSRKNRHIKTSNELH